MSSHSIRSEGGFLDTGRLVRTHAGSRPSALREILTEAGEMLRGAFEAPLRSSRRLAGYRELGALPDHDRRDIGLEV